MIKTLPVNGRDFVVGDLHGPILDSKKGWCTRSTTNCNMNETPQERKERKEKEKQRRSARRGKRPAPEKEENY